MEIKNGFFKRLQAMVLPTDIDRYRNRLENHESSCARHRPITDVDKTSCTIMTDALCNDLQKFTTAGKIGKEEAKSILQRLMKLDYPTKEQADLFFEMQGMIHSPAWKSEENKRIMLEDIQRRRGRLTYKQKMDIDTVIQNSASYHSDQDEKEAKFNLQHLREKNLKNVSGNIEATDALGQLEPDKLAKFDDILGTIKANRVVGGIITRRDTHDIYGPTDAIINERYEPVPQGVARVKEIQKQIDQASLPDSLRKILELELKNIQRSM